MSRWAIVVGAGQGEQRAEFFFTDPGGQDRLAGFVEVDQGVPQFRELAVGEVLAVAAEQAADLPFGVAAAAASASGGGGDPAADLVDDVVGEFHDVEVVDDDDGQGEVAADRGDEHGAHVDRDVGHPVAPRRRLAGQPVGDVVAGAALDLAEHAVAAVQVGEPDVPSVGEDPGFRRFAAGGFVGSRAGWGWCGVLGGAPAGPASADLVDPERVDRRWCADGPGRGCLADCVHGRGPGQAQ
nr:hypothetical protein [Candidatus Frankia alpina]